MQREKGFGVDLNNEHIKINTIYWIVFMLGFLMVSMGLGFAHNFLNNEEKKKSMHEMALKWKAAMEENAIQKS